MCVSARAFSSHSAWLPTRTTNRAQCLLWATDDMAPSAMRHGRVSRRSATRHGGNISHAAKGEKFPSLMQAPAMMIAREGNFRGQRCSSL